MTNKLKILLLPAYFIPELCSDTHLDNARYEALFNEGFEMILYTSTPTRGCSIEDVRKYKKGGGEILYQGQMHVRRFKMIQEREAPFLRAFRYFACFIKQFFLSIFGPKADVVFVVSTPPIQGMLGALIKKFTGCKFVYSLQDIFPDTLIGAGFSHKGSLLWKIGRIIENFTYSNADKIIVINNDFKRNIIEKGVPEDKIEVIYNWVDEHAVHPVPDSENQLFEEFGISRNQFRVVYAGNLGNAQNLDLILYAASRLNDIQFVIFGTGGLENYLKARKESEHIDNLLILPLQPYERVSQVYSIGNVCLVACKPGLGGSAMPSKTWSIMSAGRAVLASFDRGELKDIIEENNCGVFTDSGDLDGFVSAIVSLSNDYSKCEEMGNNGRNFILKNLTKKSGTMKYVNVIKNVVQ